MEFTFEDYFQAVDLINENIYKSKGKEAAINKAIANRRELVFFYTGDENLKKGYRMVQPVAYGISKAGNPVIRAWQIRGPSQSRNEPMWRLFRLDKIQNISVSLKKFVKPKPGFNPKGDKSMIKIYKIVKF